VVNPYPVEDEDAALEMFLVLPGGNGHVVEEAEAEGLRVLGVVAGRPHQTKSVAQSSGAN
jgi:hypothetical protein